MTRCVKIGEAKPAYPRCWPRWKRERIRRVSTPIAHVTPVTDESQHAVLVATLRRERANLKPTTTAEFLS